MLIATSRPNQLLEPLPASLTRVSFLRLPNPLIAQDPLCLRAMRKEAWILHLPLLQFLLVPHGVAVEPQDLPACPH